jgi:hypothetical protein
LLKGCRERTQAENKADKPHARYSHVRWEGPYHLHIHIGAIITGLSSRKETTTSYARSKAEKDGSVR